MRNMNTSLKSILSGDSNSSCGWLTIFGPQPRQHHPIRPNIGSLYWWLSWYSDFCRDDYDHGR